MIQDDADGRRTTPPEAHTPEEAGMAEATAEGSGDLRQDLLAGFSARAGQRGVAGERLDAESDAISGLRIDAAQVFAGNQYVYGTSAAAHAVRKRPLTSEELDEAKQAVVGTAERDRLTATLRDRPVVLLRGSAGQGKDAYGRTALLGAGHQRVFLLDPLTDLRQVAPGDLTPGAGYLLADLPQSSASALTRFDIQRLGTELRAKGCRLHVTVDAVVRFGDAQLDLDIVRIPAAPTAEDIATAQLSWCLGVAGAARARALLAGGEVRGLLRDRLPGAGAGQAAELGKLIAEVALGLPHGSEATVVARAKERLDLREGQSFEKWFETLADLARQCLAIAVATFGGEAYETVASLAVDLQERLQPEASPDNPVRPHGAPIDRTRSIRLAAIHATLVDSSVETRHGGARGKVVRFQDPGVAAQLLDHVWSEYDEIREVLPDWLRESATAALPTVGVRAAVAAGVLARYAFEPMRAKILVPWATSPNPQLRDAAATALQVVCREPAHAEAARNLVRAWGAAGSSPRLQATAARAWRVLFEQPDGTESAWSHLHTLAGVKHTAVIDAVCRSITEYMALENGGFARDALDLVDQWAASAPYGRQRRFVGELAFLYAAADLIGPAPTAGRRTGEREGDPSGPLWPSLLSGATVSPLRTRQVSALWKQVVNSRDFHGSAREVLTGWAELVEPDQRGRQALAELLVRTADDRRTHTLVRHLAQQWAGAAAGYSAPMTGALALKLLDGR